MARAEITAVVRMIPDDETIAACLMMLNLWQEANPDKLVLLMPNGEKYRYEIMEKEGRNNEN